MVLVIWMNEVETLGSGLCVGLKVIDLHYVMWSSFLCAVSRFSWSESRVYQQTQACARDSGGASALFSDFGRVWAPNERLSHAGGWACSLELSFLGRSVGFSGLAAYYCLDHLSI